MPLRASENGLRTLVTELAALHAEDVAAILATLSEGERQAVESCLDEHLSRFEFALATRSAAPFDATRLSPWLSSRLQAPETGDDPMTSQARQALLACAIRLYPPAGRAA